MTKDSAPKRVYLDTNALYGWPDPSFTVWNAFRLLNWLKCEICIPAMVERELEGQFVRAIEADRSEIQHRIRNIAKKDRSIIDFEGGVPIASPEEIRDNFRRRSENCKNHYQIRTLALPNTPVDQLAEMAIYRTPPFEEIPVGKDDRPVTGFADTLILQSVIGDLEGERNKSGRFIFISSDRIFARPEIKQQFRNHGLELMANTFALSDNLTPFLTRALRDPWVKEMDDIRDDLNAQIPSLSQEVFESLFSSDLIDDLWPNAKELNDFRVVRFVSAWTDLPASEHLPPTTTVYRRPDGSQVRISARADITMTGLSAVPNYLLGFLGNQPDDQGRQLFHATIDVSLLGTVARAKIADFHVEGVSR